MQLASQSSFKIDVESVNARELYFSIAWTFSHPDLPKVIQCVNLYIDCTTVHIQQWHT